MTILTNGDLMLDSLGNYKKILNCKEVVTDAMFEYIDKLAKSEPNDGIIASLCHWFTWSRYSGLC